MTKLTQSIKIMFTMLIILSISLVSGCSNEKNEVLSIASKFLKAIYEKDYENVDKYMDFDEMMKMLSSDAQFFSLNSEFKLKMKTEFIKGMCESLSKERYDRAVSTLKVNFDKKDPRYATASYSPVTGSDVTLNLEKRKTGWIIVGFSAVGSSAPTPPKEDKQTQQSTEPEKKEGTTAEQSGICKGLDLSITAEQLECLDRKYSTADKELNILYKQKMADLDESKKSSLKKEQIAWVKEKESKCAQAGKEMQGGTLETVMIKDCMVQMTEQRVAYLRNIK